MSERMFDFIEGDDPARAVVRIDAARRSDRPLSPYITAKFCEHLGSNILNGMSAQILRNPTFAEFPIGAPRRHPDGGAMFEHDEVQIASRIRRQARRREIPDKQVELMVEAWSDSLAIEWLKIGPREEIVTSPEAGAHGGRAQRVEVDSVGGVGQWIHLPLHRTRKYRWRIFARSNEIDALILCVSPDGLDECMEIGVEGLSGEWRAFEGELDIPVDWPKDAIYLLAVTAPRAGGFVLGRVLLEPADAIHGSDPDVIAFLRESKLPLLRWPGGNFASDYHWENGVGPADERPTRANNAWGGIEPNLFGTDEFIQFCRAARCEPLICVNVGTGTPDEAARWLEYCNGAADTPMGAKRAANGHPEPFNVRYWEIGNEIYGRFQRFWTTPEGYADRYRRFVDAMRDVDDSILFLANGCAPLAVWSRDDWNGVLIERDADILRSITDHVLLGELVAPSTDPLDLYRDTMALSEGHERAYAAFQERMKTAKIDEPRLAITEMQIFTRIAPPKPGETIRLKPENHINPATQAEALFNTLFYHAAVRLNPFIEMITHSATVNHGGGLRKERERVYANPCHYAQAMFAPFNGATPVALELECAAEQPPAVLKSCRTMGLEGSRLSSISAAAAVGADGALYVSLLNRSASGAIETRVNIDGFASSGKAGVTALSAAHPADANTLAEPERIKPVESSVEIADGHVSVSLPPYSVAMVRIPAGCE